AITLDLNVLVLGDAPGARWAAEVQPGAMVQAAGPHGRIGADPTADWHVFFSDEAGLPPMYAILEALPPAARATVFAEVAGPRDKLQNEAVAEVEINWRFRGPMPAYESRLLSEAAAEYRLPDGRCHAYIMGETGVVRDVRRTLRSRGLEVSQVSSEGLWRPGRIGGHEHVTEAAPTH
ncbi:MAG: siderophore-interacting protein, partial [Chloroflexota bacterium]